jgi:hypothetical protein
MDTKQIDTPRSKDTGILNRIVVKTTARIISAFQVGRVEGGYYPAPLSVKSGRAAFTAPSFRRS